MPGWPHGPFQIELCGPDGLAVIGSGGDGGERDGNRGGEVDVLDGFGNERW